VTPGITVSDGSHEYPPAPPPAPDWPENSSPAEDDPHVSTFHLTTFGGQVSLTGPGVVKVIDGIRSL
jgi:hypothetical protein